MLLHLRVISSSYTRVHHNLANKSLRQYARSASLLSCTRGRFTAPISSGLAVLLSPASSLHPDPQCSATSLRQPRVVLQLPSVLPLRWDSSGGLCGSEPSQFNRQEPRDFPNELEFKCDPDCGCTRSHSPGPSNFRWDEFPRAVQRPRCPVDENPGASCRAHPRP